ncbi:MAG: Hsp20 family protein [Eubacterium sp.]|nr:Hsp20 family protein [Eubacterium sp.]
MLYPGFLNEDFYSDFFDEMLNLPFSYGKRMRNEILPKKRGTTDIKEFEDRYVLEMELPGYQKDEIKAELKNGYLTVSAEHTETKETKEPEKEAEVKEAEAEVEGEAADTTEVATTEKKEVAAPKYICRERFYGKTERSFFVGKEVQKQDIKAQFTNGVLTLTIPKQVKKPDAEGEVISILDE